MRIQDLSILNTTKCLVPTQSGRSSKKFWLFSMTFQSLEKRNQEQAMNFGLFLISTHTCASADLIYSSKLSRTTVAE